MSLSSPKAPAPPPFFPIDIKATADQATAADVAGFDLRDRDYRDRFPGLVTARDYATESSYNELTGPLDPEIQSGLVRAGLGSAISAFGGEGGFEEGSAGSNTVAKTLARGVLEKQDADRGYAAFLRGANAPRAFGLSGGDIANLSIFNTGRANQAGQNAYASQVAGIQGQAAQNNQYAQLIAGLLSSGISAYGNRPKTT